MVRSRDNEAQLDELGDDPGQVGPDSGGQSGDTQGLSEIADAADALLKGEVAGGAKANLPGASGKPVTERPR